jgi:hypothetical protein
VLKQFKRTFFICLILSIHTTQALAGGHLTLDNLPKGEHRIEFSQKDFKIKINFFNQAENQLKAILDKNSFEWVRVQNKYLLPKARLKIKAKHLAQTLHLRYKSKTIHFQQGKKSSFSEVYISLFEKDEIQIIKDNIQIASIRVVPAHRHKKTTLIDYSCSRNGIKIEGLDNEYISLGCESRPIGQFGAEKPMLEVVWVSPDLKLADEEFLPYQAVFLSKRPVKIRVQNIHTKAWKILTIKARVPKRVHRLFTAYGFGPYAFNTEIINKDDKKLHKHVPMAPALFFYANYKISEETSIRGFDAAILKDSNFNNAGIYIGSNFGYSFDNKLYFTTLLGVQYLYAKFDKEGPEVSEAIFPQGVEFMYRHAFDIPNYIISGGLFLSTSDSVEYENIWLRWGKNYFWEVNLIAWKKDDFKVRTWGVSLGFPFKGFL